MTFTANSLRALLIAIAVPVLCAAPASARPPGCAFTTTASTYHPGGAAKAGGPAACGMRTGYATSETNIAVTPRGTVLFSPANTENSMASSTDGGAEYHLIQPTQMEYTALWNTVDPVLAVDHRTGRMFWAHATGATRTLPFLVAGSPLPNAIPTLIAYASGFQVYSSDDDGRTWVTSDHREAPVADWEKIAVGPARPAASGAPQPKGYPGVVYLCGNSPLEAIGPGRLCYRSLDGGRTFAIAGLVTPSPTGPQDVCPPLGANTGVVLGDGTFVQPQSCTGGAWVAVSRDEGATYSWHRVPGAPASSGLFGSLQIVADRGGTLYATWLTKDHLYYSTSSDAGSTWRASRDITPPGLKTIGRPAPAAGGQGRFGVAFYANTDAAKTAQTLYATRSLDADGANPWFATAPLEDPARPAYTDGGLTGATPRADYFGAAFDDAGTFWAAGVQQFGAPDAGGHQATSGYVGRLLASTLVTAPKGACLTSRRLVYKVGAGTAAHIVRVVVQVDGRRVLVRRGRALTRVAIPRPLKRRYVVRTTSTDGTGRGLVTTRTYVGCAAVKVVSRPARAPRS